MTPDKKMLDAMYEQEMHGYVDLATGIRQIIKHAREPAVRAEAQLAMFCLNMLATARGVQFDLSDETVH